MARVTGTTVGAPVSKPISKATAAPKAAEAKKTTAGERPSSGQPRADPWRPQSPSLGAGKPTAGERGATKPATPSATKTTAEPKPAGAGERATTKPAAKR